MASSLDTKNGTVGVSNEANKLQNCLDGFNFGLSDANDPKEDAEVDTLVKVGSQIKEITIFAGRIVKKMNKELKAAGLLYALGKTSLNKSEGVECQYELHVMLPSVGLVRNPKLSKVFDACTGVRRIVLDRVTNMTVLLKHNWRNLEEIDAYYTEDKYIFELAKHYSSVRSVRFSTSFECGSWSSVKQIATIEHVTDIGLSACYSCQNQDLFRFIRTEKKVTFIDVALQNDTQVNLLANMDMFPNLQKMSITFADDFGYGEAFKNFLIARGNMLELLSVDTHDFRNVPRIILENCSGINQLACRFQLNSAKISKDELEVIFKIRVQKESVITIKVSNTREQNQIEKLVKIVQPKSVPYKLEVNVVTNDEFKTSAFRDLSI